MSHLHLHIHVFWNNSLSVLLSINNGTTVYSWYIIDHVLADYALAECVCESDQVILLDTVEMASKIVLLLFLLAFPVAVLVHKLFNK